MSASKVSDRVEAVKIYLSDKLIEVIDRETVRDRASRIDMIRDLIHDGLEARRAKRRTEGRRYGKGPGDSK